jgi:hypothetical protein
MEQVELGWLIPRAELADMYLCYVMPCHAMNRVSSLPVFFLSGTLFHSGSLPAARFYEYRRGRAIVQMGTPSEQQENPFLEKIKIKIICHLLPTSI